MLMSPIKLVILRLYNLSLGRFAIGERILRKILVLLLIGKKKNAPYCQSARFFIVTELLRELNFNVKNEEKEKETD